MKNSIFPLVAALLLAMAALPAARFFSAAADDGFDSIAYLDYQLTDPETLYADEDVVAVACADKLVFFYGGRIYERDIRVASRGIKRLADDLYYSRGSLLWKTDLETFTETPVTNASGEQIATNNFAFSGGKLITLTNSGVIAYEDGTAGDHYAVGGLEGKYFSSADACDVNGVLTFAVNGALYADGADEPLCAANVDYMAESGGELYFSNANGIYAVRGGEPVLLYAREDERREDGVLGLFGYGDGLLFIDGATDKIMQIGVDGTGLAEFRFRIQIHTDAAVTFSEAPPTVTVPAGASVHYGTLENEAFTFTGTDVSDGDEDYVIAGEKEDYYVLYGRRGYAFAAKSSVQAADLNVAITFEKGSVLHDCRAYSTCFDKADFYLFDLKKGDGVDVLSALEINGVRYSLIRTEAGEKGFVPSGEIVRELAPSLPENATRTDTVSIRDKTTVALVIILVSTAVLACALFVLFVEKKYGKL